MQLHSFLIESDTNAIFVSKVEDKYTQHKFVACNNSDRRFYV